MSLGMGDRGSGRSESQSDQRPPDGHSQPRDSKPAAEQPG
jgi:hypothetical protein